MENKVSILYIGGSSEVVDILGSYDGIVLTAVGNLQAAEIYLKTGQLPDAILSEQFLSGGNGIELHDKIRLNPVFNQVAFILLSHEFREELFRTAFSKRIDDFYVLPIPPAESIAGRVAFLSSYHRKYPVSGPEVIEEITYKMPLSKRIFDVLLASTALIFLSPILLLVIIAIRLESKGKVYYTSKRVGREPFDFYKLRSMRTGADTELTKLAKVKNQYDIAQKKSDIDFSIPCPRCSKLPSVEKCSARLYIGGNEICDYWYRMQKAEIDKTKSAFIKIAEFKSQMQLLD